MILDRPEARNAKHGPLLKELDDALMRAKADDADDAPVTIR